MGLIEPAIFERIQSEIDDDAAFHDETREIVQRLQKQIRSAQAQLSLLHSAAATATTSLISTSTLAASASATMEAIAKAQPHVNDAIGTIAQLASKANTQPYYKWNHIWARTLENTCFTLLLAHWASTQQLLTIDQVGDALGIPVNSKEKDEFHLTIEEYLLALISLVEELARLARNSVTAGDFKRPIVIADFAKQVLAGFQLLNLKNDMLRKRSDGIKYQVKAIEDVVYDLSLRKLLPDEDRDPMIS